MSCFLTPAHRMQVKRVCIKPVIIDVIPSVKMYLDSVLLHGCYLGGEHQGRIPFVHSFQLFQRLKTRLRTLERRMRIATDTTHLPLKESLLLYKEPLPLTLSSTLSSTISKVAFRGPEIIKWSPGKKRRGRRKTSPGSLQFAARYN